MRKRKSSRLFVWWETVLQRLLNGGGERQRKDRNATQQTTSTALRLTEDSWIFVVRPLDWRTIFVDFSSGVSTCGDEILRPTRGVARRAFEKWRPFAGNATNE